MRILSAVFHPSLLCSLYSVINRKARAVYPCEAEHSSELSFEIGAIFEDGKYWQELHGEGIFTICA